MRNANGGNESMKVNILNEEEIQYWTGQKERLKHHQMLGKKDKQKLNRQ